MTNEKTSEDKPERRKHRRKSSLPRRGPNRQAGETGPNLLPMGHLTPKLKEKIIAQLAIRFKIAQTCALFGISYETFRKHRNKDPVFYAAVEQAHEHYKSVLEGVIHDRAVDGWKEEVFGHTSSVITHPDGSVERKSGTGVVGHKTMVDNKLLLELTRRHIPEFRRHTTVDQTSVNASIVVGEQTLEQLPKEMRGKLREVIQAEVERRVAERLALSSGEDEDNGDDARIVESTDV